MLECNGVLRHVQLKASKSDAKTAFQKVHTELEKKPSGCVVWIFRDVDPDSRRLRLSYRFFGDLVGEKLPSLHDFKPARHTKANSLGVKGVRVNLKEVPKSRFKSVQTTRDLIALLFGI